MVVDVVYPFGKGSLWKNNELRYSLRSLEENCIGVKNVFVIGQNPEFLSDKVIHIPYQDIYTNKSRNIMSKIHWICNDRRVSDNFVMLNDDYFFLQQINLAEYPYYWKCDLEHSIKIQFNEYVKYLKSTLNCLKSAGLNTKNFDVHRPIIFNKKKFKDMCAKYDWHIPHGYVIKSMYCNHYNIEGIQEDDVKLSRPYNSVQLEAVTEKMSMFSVGDPGLNQAMKAFLAEKFILKSKYEK